MISYCSLKARPQIIFFYYFKTYIFTGSSDELVPLTRNKVEQVKHNNVASFLIEDADHFFRDLYMDDVMEVVLDIIKEVQEDFPLTSKPFTEIANKIGLDCNELISHLKDLKSHGIMRRVAAILHHRKAGLRANAMGVWDVPIDQIEEIAPKMAAFKSVSHCYRRPTYPDWPYSLFTMIHGRSAKDCNDLLKKLSDISGITKYDALYSSKEYKKTRLKYFSKLIE